MLRFGFGRSISIHSVCRWIRPIRLLIKNENKIDLTNLHVKNFFSKSKNETISSNQTSDLTVLKNFLLNKKYSNFALNLGNLSKDMTCINVVSLLTLLNEFKTAIHNGMNDSELSNLLFGLSKFSLNLRITEQKIFCMELIETFFLK